MCCDLATGWPHDIASELIGTNLRVRKQTALLRSSPGILFRTKTFMVSEKLRSSSQNLKLMNGILWLSISYCRYKISIIVNEKWMKKGHFIRVQCDIPRFLTTDQYCVWWCYLAGKASNCSWDLLPRLNGCEVRRLQIQIRTGK